MVEGETWLQCDDCQRFFPNRDCFQRHWFPFTNINGLDAVSICQSLRYDAWVAWVRGMVLHMNLLANHVHPTKSHTYFRVCKACGKLVRVHNPHHCMMRWCSSCKQQISTDMWEQRCYIQKVVEKEEKKTSLMIFFDIEASQDKKLDDNKHGEVFEHEIGPDWVTRTCLFFCE